MQPIYNTHRALAMTVATASTGLALWIVTHDAFTSGHWTIDHLMMPMTVLTTIVAGHLAVPALKARRRLAALGFGLLFAFGLVLELYNSVGRVAEQSNRSTLAAVDSNQRRAAEEADLKRNQKMLDAERGLIATACANPESRKCRGVTASIKVYEAAVKGNRATLKEIGPEQPVQARAGYIAGILSLIGIDEAATVRVLSKIESAFANVFLVLTSIVAFGFAFAARREVAVAVEPPPAARRPEPEVAPAAPILLDDVRHQRAAAAKRLQGLTPAEVKAQDAETLAVIRKARRPLSNRELAQCLGCSEGQASKRWQRVREHLQLGWENKERRISAA